MLKTIMVHIDSSKRTPERLSFAAALARSNGARLVGAFGQRAEAERIGAVITWPSHDYIKFAAKARALFEESAAGIPAQWIDINRGSDENILKGLAKAAQYCDVTVMSQTGPDDEDEIAEDLPEELAALSGRPVLIMPRQGKWTHSGLSPLIVWDDSIESARAIRQSMSLIPPNAEATVLAIGLSNSDIDKQPLDMVSYFADHGIKARCEYHEFVNGGSWELIRDRLAKLGSDLLVIGAHEELGFPFVRREVVREWSPVPVLMTS